MSADDRPSDEIDTMAYAVSFCQAAERLADTDWNDNHPLVVPFYALIGFALENGLKAAYPARFFELSDLHHNATWNKESPP